MSARTLIEQWFPAPMVGAESLRERGASSALPPLNFLHVWWARRPLTTSRAAIVASLLPAWPTDDEVADDESLAQVRKGLEEEFPGGEIDYRSWFLKTLGILGDPVGGRRRIAAARTTGERLDDGGYGYKRAFTVTPEATTVERLYRLMRLRVAGIEPISVLDPFAGGGSIPFEAARFGLRALAGELNPVAAAILEGTVVLPAELGASFTGILQERGTRWAERVRKRLDRFFPMAAGDSKVVAYIWAHTVPCPTTGLPTPLAPDFWLAHGKAGRDVAVKIAASGDRLDIEIIEGKHAAEWGKRSTYKRGVGTSIWTAETFSGDYIREQAQNDRMGFMLLAVCVNRTGMSGRHFRAPSEQDIEAAEAASVEVAQQLSKWEIDDVVPTEEIPYGTDTRPQKHGMKLWRQMFTPRQLLTAVTAVQELRAVVGETKSDLGPDVARALNLYLALGLDKAVDYNSRLSSWHATRTTVRNTFDRHDFSFKWSFAEFDGAHAVIPWAVSQIVDSYKGMAALMEGAPGPMSFRETGRAEVALGSATALGYDTGSIDAVITDPPYYDNVMYGECSDYFYVWMKRSLRDSYPELCELLLSDKEKEAVANPTQFRDVAQEPGPSHGQGKRAAELADQHYEELLTQSFREAHRVLKDEGTLTVMFTHKRVDAWDTLGRALLEADFAIHSSWPVHTESEHSLHQAKKNAATSTILLTARKRQVSQPAYWADLRNDVATAARTSAARFSEEGLTGVDLTIATFGPVLGVLSKGWPVYSGDLDDEGNPIVLRPDVALDLARQEVARLKKRGLLGGREVEFDRITDYYLLAWADFQAAEFPSGEALKLSIATHLDLDDLARQYKVIKSASGSVTLLDPAQRRTAGAISSDQRQFSTWLDVLHCLMLVYEEEGLSSAQRWVEMTEKAQDQRFADLLSASLHAIPRVKDHGEFARPEAKTLEGLRATLFPQVKPPPEESEESASQQALLL